MMSAAFRLTASQSVSRGSDYGAALASACPATMFRTVWKELLSSLFDYEQQAKPQANKTCRRLAFIVPLSRPISPSTIRRFIVTMRINSIKRVIRWTWSHVGVERFERFAPALAHRDATAPVVFPMGCRWCVATRQHVRVSPIFLRPVTALAVAVFVVSGGCVLALNATATLGVADFQVHRQDRGDGSAVALTAPQDRRAIRIASASGHFDHGQASDSFSNAVFNCARHNKHFTMELNPCDS